MINSKFTIKKLFKTKNTIKIHWNDKKVSNFDFLWLRDNCPKDIHPTARERLFNLVNVSEDIRPESYEIKKSGELENLIK